MLEKRKVHCDPPEYFDMKRLFISIMILFSGALFSQKKQLDWASYYYFNKDYSNALTLYSKAGDSLPLDALQKQAKAFVNSGDITSALQVLQQIVDNPMAVIEDYYLFAQLLTDNPKLASEYREKAAQLPIPYQSLWQKDSLLYKKRFKEVVSQEVSPLDLNTEEAEFAPVLIPTEKGPSQLLFVTSRKMEGEKKKVKRILSQYPIYNLAKATLDTRQTVGAVSLFELGLNTVLQDGPVAYDSVRKTLYLTRSADKRDSQGVIHLDLYRIQYPDSQAKVPTALSVNSKGFSSMHPAYDAINKRLFFSSDRPGGYGGFDLYVAQQLPDGTFLAPVNLGKDINTKANEVFPNWVLGQLSYASKSDQGIGGLDIWLAEERMRNRWKKDILGAPYNSPADDFGWTYDAALNLSIQTSSRKGGKGDDDLYTVVPMPFLKGVEDEYDYIISDTLVVGDNGVHSNDEVLLAQQNPLHRFFKRSYELVSTPKGALKWNKNGSFLYFNPVVESVKDSFYYRIRSSYGASDPVKVVVRRKDKSISNLPEDIKTTFAPVYFDYDNADLLIQYKSRLDKIVKAMRQYPKMIVRVNSFTDSRGKSSYNMRLSKERHETMIAYIEKELNETGRLTGVAYGETQVPGNELKNYLLYGGSYGAKSNAEKEMARYIKAGYNSFLDRTTTSLFRVVVASFESFREANKTLQKLESEWGIKLWVDKSPVNKFGEEFHRQQRKVTFELLAY